MAKNGKICEISGKLRALLTAERPALNFLQMLSATATSVRQHVDALSATGLSCKIYDTRKTIPGLRLAQKYAVKIGGGENQRLGLYDGILIKENHIVGCGGVAKALEKARSLNSSNVTVQIEVENFDELREALSAGAKSIILDNFDVVRMKQAVEITNGAAVLEVSGGIKLDNVVEIAATGVDRISIGALTKNIAAVDFSWRIL
jgi:nicotinate-nucleotide pyrophosphorylase (carboxylating)